MGLSCLEIGRKSYQSNPHFLSVFECILFNLFQMVVEIEIQFIPLTSARVIPGPP